MANESRIPADVQALDAVYRHNRDTHKIGETDGFTPEVAADLGFLSGEEIMRQLTDAQQTETTPHESVTEAQVDNTNPTGQMELPFIRPIPPEAKRLIDKFRNENRRSSGGSSDASAIGAPHRFLLDRAGRGTSQKVPPKLAS